MDIFLTEIQIYEITSFSKTELFEKIEAEISLSLLTLIGLINGLKVKFISGLALKTFILVDNTWSNAI